MLVFLKARLVLFATPKTASTSIETALGAFADMQFTRNPNVKHTPFRKYKRFLKPYLETFGSNFECAAVVREPTDWLGSWYRYRGRDALTGAANSTAGIDFDAFVRAYMLEEPPAFARVGSQSRFLTDNQGHMGVEHLFRYDDLGCLHQFLEQRLQCQFDLGHENQSPQKTIDLPSDTYAALRDFAARDYALYDQIAGT